MKIKIILSVITISLNYLSCSAGTQTTTSPFGSYIYRSYNYLGEMVGDGTIYINKSDSNLVTGNWSIQKVKNCDNCGPQFGSGYLAGKIVGDSMFINLNPDNTQDKTELTGILFGGRYSGEWRWESITRFGNKGTFDASRQ